jgi:PAS domain S-box-containing protein
VKILGGLCLALNLGVTLWLLRSSLTVFRKGGLQVKFLISVVIPFFVALLLGTGFHVYRASTTEPTTFLNFVILGLAILYMMVASAFGALLYVFNKEFNKRESPAVLVSELEQNKRKLLFAEFAVDHVTQPTVWLSSQRKVLYFNPSLCEMLGYEEIEFSGMSLSQWFPSIPERWFEEESESIHHEVTQAALLTSMGRRLSASIEFWGLRECQNKFIFLTFTPLSSVKAPSVSLEPAHEPDRLVLALREQCHLLLESLADMVLLYTLDGGLVEFNQACCKFLGYSQDELSAMNMKDIDTNYVDGALWRHKLSSTPVLVNTAYRAKDDSLLQVEVRLSLVDWQDQSLIMATTRDVKDRLNREASLKQTEITLRTLLDKLSHAVLVVDLYGKLIDVNDTTLQYFALTKSQLLELNFVKLIDLDSLPQSFVLYWKEVLDWKFQAIQGQVRSFLDDSTFPAKMEMKRVSIRNHDFVMVELYEIEEIDRLKRMLQVRQEQFQAVVQLANVGFANWDIATNALYWSDVFDRLFRLEPQSFDKKYDTFISLIHPDDRIFVDQHIRRSVEERMNFAIEFRLSPQANDDIVWIKLQSLVVADHQGKVVRVVQAAQDITLYKQHEEALLQHESKWRAWVQNSSDWITLLSSAGVIWYSSPAVYDILGYSGHDLVGKNLFEFIHAEEHQQVQEGFERLSQLPSDQSVSIKYRCIHANGEWRYLETRGSNWTAQEGIGGYVLNTRDISDRRYTEMALSQAVENNRALLAAMPDLVLHLNHGGLCLSVAAGAEWGELSQVTSQWTEESIENIFSEDYVTRLYEAMNTLFTVGDAQIFEYPMMLAERHFVVESRLSLYRSRECVLLLRDVTDRSTIQAVRAQYETVNRALLEAIPDLIIYSDDRGKFLDVLPSQNFETIGVNEWQGKTVYELLPYELAEQRVNSIQEALRLQTSVIYEQEFPEPQGTRFEEVRIVPIKPGAVLCIIRDISSKA